MKDEVDELLKDKELFYAEDTIGIAIDLNTLDDKKYLNNDLTIKSVEDENSLKEWLKPIVESYKLSSEATEY